jgi:hypothetical protein
VASEEQPGGETKKHHHHKDRSRSKDKLKKHKSKLREHQSSKSSKKVIIIKYNSKYLSSISSQHPRIIIEFSSERT